jgi:hypothetical protein
MGKVVHAVLGRHGGCCSAGTFLFDRLAIVPDVFVEQLEVNCRDSLKYIQINRHCYEQVERAAGENRKSVQPFYVGGIIG